MPFANVVRGLVRPENVDVDPLDGGKRSEVRALRCGERIHLLAHQIPGGRDANRAAALHHGGHEVFDQPLNRAIEAADAQFRATPAFQLGAREGTQAT